MKRLILFFFAVALFSSCVEETLPVDSPTAESVPSFSAVRENFATPGKDTKTILRYDRSVEWTKGDGVGLFDGTSIQRSDYTIPTKLVDDGWCISYKYVAASNGSETSFSYLYYGKDAEEHKSHIPAVGKEYFLLYPWNTNFLANPSKGEFRCWIKKEQTAEAGTYDASRGFAVARTTDLSQPVVFRNAVSLLEFVITPEMDSKIVSIAVKGNNSEALGGNILVKLAEDGTVTTSAWNENAEYKAMDDKGFEKVITFKGPDTGLAAGKYYLSVMPNTLSKGITVTATDINGSTYVRTSSASFTFKPSMIYGMGEIEGGTYTTEGITELPYVFSLYTKAGNLNECKYLRSVKGTVTDSKTAVLGTIMHYDDQTGTSLKVSFSGVTTSGGTDYYRNTDVWADAAGFDNIPVKSMISEESAAKGTYGYAGENYYLLTAPLQCNLPSSFDVSFGLFVDGGLANWNVYISDNIEDFDGDGVTDAVDTDITPHQTVTLPATKVNYYYTVNVENEGKYVAGKTLYVKVSPTGTKLVTGGTGTGWNKQSSLHTGFLITDATKEFDTYLSKDPVYFEPFDNHSTGIDYLIGHKLCNMANVAGSAVEGQTYVYQRPGYAQIGYVNYQIAKATSTADKPYYNGITNNVGSFKTPVLEAGNLILSFKAMAYQNPGGRRTHATTHISDIEGDITSVTINIHGGGTINGEETVTVSGLDYLKFTEFTCQINGATSETYLEFTSAPESGQFSRWFIDDICVTRSGETADQIKVMSFNVNNSLTEDSGLMDTDPKRWTVRRYAINEMLKEEKPAVMGGQEVTSVQLSDIAGFGYGAYGIGRTDGGVTEESGEMMGIFYDQSQVTLEENGTFWLNEDGTVGEKGWDAGYVRIASWARFSLAGKSYKKFIVLNTHLDNTGAESRKQSIIKIKNKLKEINPNGLPVVLLGDFNIVATDRIFDVLKPDFVDTRAVAPETDTEPTYTKWGEEGFAGRVIDHIFASGFDILKYRTVNDRTYRGKGTFFGFPFDETCPNLSDHDPVTAILEF